MNIKYGQVTMYIISEIDNTTFMVLDSNVGLEFIKVDSDKAVQIVKMTAKKLGANFGNFELCNEKITKTSEYNMPSFVAITDDENEKLKKLSEQLKEFDGHEYKGIEAHGEAGWMLPADEKRYFKRNYIIEDEYDCTIHIVADIANDVIRWHIESEGDTLYGNWYSINNELAKFIAEFNELLEEPLDFLDDAYNDGRVISLFDEDDTEE